MNVSLANKLMVDVASHLGEGVMVKDDCIEHEDLCYEQLSKSTTFAPPRIGPSPWCDPSARVILIERSQRTFTVVSRSPERAGLRS